VALESAAIKADGKTIAITPLRIFSRSDPRLTSAPGNTAPSCAILI
jgi:hypothetical protein